MRIFAVGMEATRVRMVGEAEVLAFADWSGDKSRIHVDPDYAHAQGYDGLVAHGAMLTGYFSEIIGTELPGDAGLLMSLQLNFLKPVVVPKEIALRVKVTHFSEATQTLTLELIATDPTHTIRYASGTAKTLLRHPVAA